MERKEAHYNSLLVAVLWLAHDGVVGPVGLSKMSLTALNFIIYYQEKRSSCMMTLALCFKAALSLEYLVVVLSILPFSLKTD